MLQHPPLSQPVQPAIIINIVGAKWYLPRCRAGFSSAQTRRPVIAPPIAHFSVRRTISTMRLSGLRCSAICLTKRGGEYETNFYINFGDCAGWGNCRCTINVVSVGLCRGGGRIYGNSKQFVPIRIYIRRYGGQLFNIIARGGVHNVCASEYRIQ